MDQFWGGTEKLLDSLRRGEFNNAKRKVVLLSTGALNPVHIQHLRNLEAAKHDLETRFNMQVLAGWLSPSHRRYTQPKCEHYGTLYLPTASRLEMTRLTTKDSTWISVGSWESMFQDQYWPDYPEVAAELHRHLTSIGLGDFAVFYVCGQDHFERCGMYDGAAHFGGKHQFGIVMIPRGDSGCSIQTNPEINVYVVQVPPSEMSSTLIRDKLQKGESLTGCLPPEIIEYMNNEPCRSIIEAWRKTKN